MLDRIDIQVEVRAVAYDQLRSKERGMSSAEMRENIQKARELQKERFRGTDILFNSEIPPAKLREYCVMEQGAEAFLKSTFDSLGLSARGYDRIMKVARTVADMDGSRVIQKKHISMAVQYRTLDRKYWR